MNINNDLFKNPPEDIERLSQEIRDELDFEILKILNGDYRQYKFKDGEPCNHPGCLNHRTHPCEGCGRIAGSYE